MSARLHSRQRFIPGGFRFRIPALKWEAPRNASFNSVVDRAIDALNANPMVAQQLGWSLEWNAMADRVDEFNAKICAAHGWDEYINADDVPSIPKMNPRDQQTALQNLRSAAARVKEMVAGAKTLLEWRASGELPVSPELAEKRAAVCAECPLNSDKDWTSWFTVPAAELIRKQVEEAHDLGLKTSLDEKLHCCTACHCPLQVKVWPAIEWITKRLTPDQMTRLRSGKNCWILSESAQ